MRVLAVLPSTALGGGIERYSQAVLGALSTGHVKISHVALNTGTRVGPARKLRFLLELYRAGRDTSAAAPVTVLVFHPALAPAAEIALSLARTHRAETIVFCYGQEIWGLRTLERRLIRRGKARLVTISSFSAGALATLGLARLLPPGLDPMWYGRLISVSRLDRSPGASWHLLSVFRLDDCMVKGAYALLECGDRLVARGLPIRLKIAGSGVPPEMLKREVAKRSEWAELVPVPSDDELARLYGWADLFVLATKTSTSHPLSTEGFGIVLAEAQVAGVPVVAPAFGGASSAYLNGVTGVAPVDESVGSLARVLEQLLNDPETLSRLAQNAAIWARHRFDPSEYADTVLAVLFDEPASHRVLRSFPVVLTADQESEESEHPTEAATRPDPLRSDRGQDLAHPSPSGAPRPFD